MLEGTSYERVGERTKLLTNTLNCDVTLAEDRYLTRHLSDQRLPHHRAFEMAVIDLNEETPFARDEVHLCLAQDVNSSAPTQYYVIKKAVLDPVIVDLIAAGIRPRTILLQSGDRKFSLSSQSLKSVHPIFGTATRSRKMLNASGGLLALLIIVTFGNLYYRYVQANALLEVEILDKHSRALEVRKLLDRRTHEIALVESARKRKALAVPIVRVWEELTKALPDSAWITDFTLNDDVLTFSGFADSAAGLISTLDASPLFAEPAFTSPVVRIPGQAGERFTIKLSVVQA